MRSVKMQDKHKGDTDTGKPLFLFLDNVSLQTALTLHPSASAAHNHDHYFDLCVKFPFSAINISYLQT